MYSTKLFDLLTPGEVSVVTKQTEIRNVYVNDLTVAEVFDLTKCILQNKTLEDSTTVAMVLNELWRRYKNKPTPKAKWYCDQHQFGGGERCLNQCDSCEGLGWGPSGPLT